MFRLLLSVVMLFGLVGSAYCESTKTDAAYGVRYTEEQVLQLPQDQDKFYLSVIGNPADPRYVKVKGWFSQGGVNELVEVRNQCHFHFIETTSVMFRDRYAKTVSATPCIRLQTAEGVIVYQASGDAIPFSGEATSKAINAECIRRWRERHNPKPKPDPEPAPLPEPEPTPDVVPEPDVQPEPPAPEPSFPWLMLVAACGASLAVGGSIGVGKEVVKEYRSRH